jgi:hypothetical protein
MFCGDVVDSDDATRGLESDALSEPTMGRG